MKRITAILLIGLILLTAFAGCSNKTKLDPKKPVTLTMWHVYGSQTQSPLNDVIGEFNSTVGAEKGIVIKVEMVTDSSKIDDALKASLTNEPGAQALPDLFVAYPRMAEQFKDDVLLDFSKYFTEKELSEYRKDFLDEGYFDGKLLMLPIAKSSELIFVNKTIFDRFAADTNITMDCFKTIDDLMAACDAYYDWSNGSTTFIITSLPT